jgi:membrane carboxypeptidase/penicillin-binding protein
MTTSGRPNTCHDGEMTTDTFRVLVHGRNHRPCFVSVPEPEAPSSPKILIYPNPATTSVHVQFDLNEESAKVIFYNVMGVAVHRQDLAGKKGTIAIETRNWASGVYTAKIIGRNGENLGVSKLVIVK